jgi:RHS repeat-associated protein
VRGSSGATTPFGFTGAPQSGDLVHLDARDLNTGIGRFLSVDPVRPGAPGSVGWNPYSYVANNPTTYTDPSGETTVAGEYATLARSAIMLIPALIALSFLVRQPFVATGSVLPIPVLGRGPEPSPDPDPEPEPNPRPIPLPLPFPDTTNKPRPMQCRLGGPSWYNYWGPTSQPAGADACLVSPLSGGSSPSYDPPGWVSQQIRPGVYRYHRGHIIGKQLGGKGGPPNLFTQCGSVNSNPMQLFEGKVAGVVNRGETVYYSVGLHYFGRVIPDSVSAWYTGSGREPDSFGKADFSNIC